MKGLSMRRLLLSAAVLLSLSAVAQGVSAAPACRDAKGKFIKCPPPAPPAATRCKDAKGKYAKCSAPGAKPV
jgi:hypothetical protein